MCIYNYVYDIYTIYIYIYTVYRYGVVYEYNWIYADGCALTMIPKKGSNRWKLVGVVLANSQPPENRTCSGTGSIQSPNGFVWNFRGNTQKPISGWWLTYPSEKYERQLGWLFPIYGKIKHVPNHQTDMIYVFHHYQTIPNSQWQRVPMGWDHKPLFKYQYSDHVEVDKSPHQDPFRLKKRSSLS